MAGLNSEISSLYRLFLRAISASVLHHSTATKNLRKLWRPTFVEAAKIDAERRGTQDIARRELLDEWMVRWNERVDNTLHMLHSAATNRGLSHKVTRNLGFLVDSHTEPLHPKDFRSWNPQLPPDSKAYAPPVAKSVRSSKEEKRLQMKEERKDDVRRVFHAVGQVVRLAEGRSGITLGRLPHAKPFRGRDTP